MRSFSEDLLSNFRLFEKSNPYYRMSLRSSNYEVLEFANNSNYSYLHPLLTGKILEMPLYMNNKEYCNLDDVRLNKNLITYNDDRITTYLKSYKKLIVYYFTRSSIRKYSPAHLDKFYYIGKGIILDEKFEIIALVTKNYGKSSDMYTEYSLNCNVGNLSNFNFYIRKDIYQKPSNAFEKFLVKNLINSFMELRINKISIEESIDKLFMRRNRHSIAEKHKCYAISNLNILLNEC